MHRDYLVNRAGRHIATDCRGRYLLTVAALAIAIGCVCHTPTQAGVIPLVVGPPNVSGGGTASVTGPFTPIPNNFPSAVTANFAAIQKTFTSTAPIDIVFNVTPSDGVTEYLFAEGIFNASGIAWNDYHIQLGFGVGVNFVPADPAIGLQFDATPAPSSADFANFTLFPQALDFFNGLIPSNSGLSLSFTIDVPNIVGRASQFTLRQFPSIVPEPTSLALLGCGALGMVAIARRRWQSS